MKRGIFKTFSIVLLALTACSTPHSNQKGEANDGAPSSLGSGSPADHDGIKDSQKNNQNFPASAKLIEPGYLFEVSSLQDSGISGKYRVEFDGTLRLSYGVTIDTTGMTEEAARAKIIEAYGPFIKSANSIKIILSQKKLWLDVRGLVQKPGRYLVEHTTSIDEVLNMAGGLLSDNRAEYVKVQKKAGSMAFSLSEYYDTGNTALVPSWEGGEIIFFQRRNEINSMVDLTHPVIHLLGEVQHPGEYPYRADADFLYYLTKAGGPSSLAELSEVEVIRWEDGKRKSNFYNWKAAQAIAHLEPSDLVLVHSNQMSPLERTLQSATGIGAILSAIGILIIAL